MRIVSALSILLLAATATPLAARGFINSGQEWLLLTAVERAVYIRGVNDAANFVFVDEGLDGALAKVGRTKCLIEKRTSVTQIAEMITSAYTDQAASFGNLPPLVVYIAKIGDFCRDIINRERREFGLPPQ